MTINAHREASRALAAATRFLVYAVDHHERTKHVDARPDIAREQVRVRRLTAASDIASATKHLAEAAMWLAMEALEAKVEEDAQRDLRRREASGAWGAP